MEATIALIHSGSTNPCLPQGRALTARSLAARAGETDRIHFLCGTQSLQHENQVSPPHNFNQGGHILTLKSLDAGTPT